MGKIWLSSDTHFCHNKDFIYKPRGFQTVEEMNETIVKNWNQRVAHDDTVYLLGDCMLNNDIAGCGYLRRLNGKIFIITGNHDTATRIQKYVNIRYDILHLGLATTLAYKGYNFYLSHYPTLCDNHDGDKPLERRVISLCGHTHTQDKFADWEKGLIYHVELDAHQNCPVLLDDIINDIKEKIKE